MKSGLEMLLALGIGVSLFWVSLSDGLINVELEGCGVFRAEAGT